MRIQVLTLLAASALCAHADDYPSNSTSPSPLPPAAQNAAASAAQGVRNAQAAEERKDRMAAELEAKAEEAKRASRDAQLQQIDSTRREPLNKPGQVCKSTGPNGEKVFERCK